MELKFIKTSPTENMTLLIETPVPREQHLEVAEKLCDQIAIIKGGKLIISGSTEEGRGNTSLEDVFLELEEA